MSLLDRLIRTPEGIVTFIERPDGTRLHCISVGEGPTVILAHGIFNELRCFNLVLPVSYTHLTLPTIYSV